jgi:hypothetical protein
LAARADFGVEEVDDLRLAVEELCLLVVGSRTNGTLELKFTRDGDDITIACCLAGGVQLQGVPTDGATQGMSVQIINALVDEHGFDIADVRSEAWIRKRGSKVAD